MADARQGPTTNPHAAGLHEDFLNDGIAVRDAFLTPSHVRDLAECAEARLDRGEFRPARVGSEANLQRRDAIRGDSTCWLGEPLEAPERALSNVLEALRLELNREALLGLFDLEMHFARYAPGTGYARHVDQLRGRDQRVVSLIVYLNGAWPPDAGGELRLYGSGAAHRDIQPVGGRLVYFLTAGREHEVLPTRRARLSVSGWFRRR